MVFTAAHDTKHRRISRNLVVLQLYKILGHGSEIKDTSVVLVEGAKMCPQVVKHTNETAFTEK